MCQNPPKDHLELCFVCESEVTSKRLRRLVLNAPSVMHAVGSMRKFAYSPKTAPGR
uniref:Uncharacterized protein n=1 Tax=Rhizophora mucronata TaxID=61149 RepID=A0A2P2R051_RHIMU